MMLGICKESTYCIVRKHGSHREHNYIRLLLGSSSIEALEGIKVKPIIAVYKS